MERYAQAKARLAEAERLKRGRATPTARPRPRPRASRRRRGRRGRRPAARTTDGAAAKRRVRNGAEHGRARRPQRTVACPRVSVAFDVRDEEVEARIFEGTALVQPEILRYGLSEERRETADGLAADEEPVEEAGRRGQLVRSRGV